MFSAAPIPASFGTGNPVNLAPGQPVPSPSAFTSNTVDSTVRTDAASYERSEIAPPSIGPDGVDTVQSVGPSSTTTALAGQQPLQSEGDTHVLDNAASSREQDTREPVDVNPRTLGAAAASLTSGTGTTTAFTAAQRPLSAEIQKSIDDINSGRGAHSVVPQTVEDSIARAHQDPEASAYPEAVQGKSVMERELLSQVGSSDGKLAPVPVESAALSETVPAASRISETPEPSVPAADHSETVTDRHLHPEPTAVAAAATPTGEASSSSGLNAAKDAPAQTPATQSQRQDTTVTPATDDIARDASSAAQATQPQTQPTVTTGVEDSRTPTISAPASAAAQPSRSTSNAAMASRSPAGKVANGAGHPSPTYKGRPTTGSAPNTPGSARTSTSTTSAPGVGEKKKRGFLSKLKEKFK